MIVFNSSSYLNLSEIKKISPYALKLTIIFMFLVLLFMTIFTNLIFFNDITNTHFILVSLLFAAIMSGTDSGILLGLVKKTENKILEILQIESIINTPFTILFPILVLGFITGTNNFTVRLFLIDFSRQFFIGVGAGLIFAAFYYWYSRKKVDMEFSPLMVIGVALATYVLAENIGGNGILAVTILGVLYGMFKIKAKVEMNNFTNVFTEFLKIFMFIILGLIISIDFSATFILKSLLLFALYIFIRFIAVLITLRGSQIENKEKIFMALIAPKGIAVALVIFVLFNYSFNGLDIVLRISLMFILYSIILGSITTALASKFLKLKEKQRTTFKRLKKLKKSKLTS